MRGSVECGPVTAHPLATASATKRGALLRATTASLTGRGARLRAFRTMTPLQQQQQQRGDSRRRSPVARFACCFFPTDESAKRAAREPNFMVPAINSAERGMNHAARPEIPAESF